MNSKQILSSSSKYRAPSPQTNLGGYGLDGSLKKTGSLKSQKWK